MEVCEHSPVWRMLWLTVIREAQVEVTNGELTEHQRYLAKRWLTTWSRSFATVCSYAGLETEEARALQEGMRKQWRA